MSLLDRLNLGGSSRQLRHLDDSQFADIWSAATAAGQPAVHPHLTSCAQCRSGYAAFTGWLARIHDDALADADEAFPSDRLAAQQAQVMRRLEALERPARVIAFPRFTRPVTSTQGQAQRWVAAAAAAGLVIGVAAGQFFDVRNVFTPNATEPPVQNARLGPSPSGPSVIPISVTSVSDEALFYGGDPAPTTVRLSMLQSMDDITPRARDLDVPR